jgi:hypothetical protein
MSRINIGKVAPIPKGDWVQSEPYEKLNMVNKSGVLYIAKQDVPVNTAITNIDYWMPASGQLSIGTVETVSASTGASATITDGSNGPELNLSIPRGVTGNESIDDTKGKGDTDYVWSADKNYEEITNKASIITETASGSIASFTDGSASPVTALSVSIDPVQDLHGYDNPWPAGGGKNLFQTTATTQTIVGTTFTVAEDGSVTIKGTPSANINGNFVFGSVTLPAGDYKVNGNPAAYSGGLRITVYNENTSTAISSVYGNLDFSFTLTETTTIRLYPFVQTTFDGNAITLYPMIRLASISDATFAPYSNICPISGHTSALVTRTGKNLIDASSFHLFTASGRKYLASSSDYGKNGAISVKPSTTYTFSIDTSDDGIDGKIFGFNLSGTRTQLKGSWSKKTTFTTPSDCVGISFYCRVNDIQAPSDAQPMLELGSVPSSFEPYQGQTVTIDLGEERYGGTLDVITGQMTVDRGFVELDGSEDEAWYRISGGKPAYTDAIKNLINPPASASVKADLISNEFVVQTSGQTWNANVIGIGSSAAGIISISLHNNQTATRITEIQQFLAQSPAQVVYKLKTPLTVQLSPSQLSTLLGQNNVWADTGDVEVTYRADTKLYIEKLTQPTEDDMIANNNIEANKFFMLGNSLYYSTAAIAVGTSIIPGNNCTKLSLADALNNLNS